MNWNKFWNDSVEKVVIIALLLVLAFFIVIGIKSFKSEKELNDLKAEKLRMEIQVLKASNDTIK